MKRNKLVVGLVLASICVLISSAIPAKAVLLAYEPFDYAPAQSLIGLNGGIGFNSAWLYNSSSHSNNMVIVSGSFTYTDQYGNQLLTSGNRVHVTGDGSDQGDNTGGIRGTASAQPLRVLSFYRGSGNVETETTWISLLALRTGLPHPYEYTPGSYLYYGRAASFQPFWVGDTNSTTQGSERIAIGRASQNGEAATLLPKDTWGALNRGAATQSVVSQVPLTNLVFLLVRIDHVPGVNPGNDTAYIWINPSSLVTEPLISTADITISASQFGSSDRDYNFDRIRLFGGSWNSTVGYGSIQVDEIRIGTTFADVTPLVPEPSAVVLSVLGGLGLLVLRLRRKQ